MPERIVDIFELVDVQEEHGESFPEALHLEYLMIEQVREQRPVRQSGQQVMIGLVLDGIFGALSLGDVAVDSPVSFQTSGVVKEGDAARFQDHPASILMEVDIFEQRERLLRGCDLLENSGTRAPPPRAA